MKRVLVIDDDPVITQMLDSMLSQSKSPQFEIIKINAGTEGVQAVRDYEPDIVVLDLMMPGLSGWDVLKQIRIFSQVPILVLSAVVDPDMVSEALDEGANDYLIKPAPSGVLISRINRLLKPKQ